MEENHSGAIIIGSIVIAMVITTIIANIHSNDLGGGHDWIWQQSIKELLSKP